jgi:hypothetical protein
VFLEPFRPVVKGTLRGFARLRSQSGLIIDEISMYLRSDGGSAWASPWVDATGATMRDPKTGKVKYAASISFSTANVRKRWSDWIAAVVREAQAEVFR